MEDFIKGIIVGVVVVKLFESDLVQNYIHKKTKEFAEEAGHNFVDAVFNNKKEDIPKYVYLRDEDGKMVKVKAEAVQL